MMFKRKAAVLIGLVSVVLLGLAPIVFASPINATLSWTATSIPNGSTNTATFGVKLDSDCPSGQTFSGVLTVVQPDGVSIGTVTVGSTACGTSLTAVYPTAFSGSASTLETGVYKASWNGTSSTLVGGHHPTFGVVDYFQTPQFPPPPTVPEFGVPALLVGAVGLVLLVTLRKSSVIKV